MPELPGTPLLGHLSELKGNAIPLFERAAREGDVVRLRVPFESFVLVSHPDGVEHVLSRHAKRYKKSRTYTTLKPLLGEGLLTSEGELWHRQRRLAQPSFHRNELAGLVPMMAEQTRALIGELHGAAREGRQVEVTALMVRLTLGIVGRALFHRDLSREADGAGRALTIALDLLDRRINTIFNAPLWVPTPANVKLRGALGVLDGLVSALVEERRREGGGTVAEEQGAAAAGCPFHDLLSRLMAATDPESGLGMSERQLRDEMMTFLLAGHETTAHALTWTLVLLARHPEWRRRVAEEASSVLGDREPEASDLPRLEMARRVICESMRMLPPVWVVEREALEADVVEGFEVPVGAWLVLSPYVTQRLAAFWPDPERFDPDRFAPERSEGRHDFAWFPFGAGPRHCIGRNFAMMEMLVILPMLCRELALDLVAGHPIELEPKITLRPRHGVRATVARMG